ncbi:MAG: glycosyltransferase family 4 protein [Geobacteraceae bacterium]|nr:glycosyltransferase family 4 protein [Geobacteraceae bacterium]
MKILMLSTFDTRGGAAIAARRLHTGLRRIGIDSRMLVQEKGSDDPFVIEPATPLRRALSAFRPMLDSLPLRQYPQRQRITFSPAMLPDRLNREITKLSPEIVHLHWVAAGFLRIETLAKLNRPLIWTLHDSWPFTGGCHLPFDCLRYREACGACPTLGSARDSDLTRRIWNRKRKAWENLDLTVIAPSRWLAECAGASALFRQKRIEVLPNGLDTNRFRPIDKGTARDILSLPRDRKLLMFGGVHAASDPNKGFQYLADALRKLSAQGWGEKAEVLVFGSTEPDQAPDFGLKCHYLGHVHDDVTTALLYCSADIFVAPSTQENLPNTVMEAAACGTPSVAFAVGGLPDLVEHGRTGWLARPFETDDLAKGIASLLVDDEKRTDMGYAARNKVVSQYALERIARRHAELYEELAEP